MENKEDGILVPDLGNHSGARSGLLSGVGMKEKEKLTKYYSLEIVCEYARRIGSNIGDILKSKINPPKLLCYEEALRVPQVIKDLSRFSDKFLINTSKPELIEIIPKDINKGIACQMVAKMHNVSMDEVICVGDSDNDLKMLEVAGFPIVVENGTDNAKKIAKFIAPNCNKNPIATIIEKFC